MDIHALRDLLCSGPQPALLQAIYGGHDLEIIPLLDAELQRSSSRLQRLREYRNARTSPMYRLHPEILSNIFYIYAQDNDELYNLRWTRVLLVCRRWHDIAINASSLWSFIDVNFNLPVTQSGFHNSKELDTRDIRRIEMQRTRAALSPLTIRMAFHATQSEAKLAYASMFWNPHSLSSLAVAGEHIYVDHIARIIGAHRHENLRSLVLHSFPSSRAALTSSLDTALLRDNLPQLQHLEITDLPVNWSLVHGLRSLHMSFTRIPSIYPSIRNIADTLSRCPQLEVLFITVPPDASSSSNASVSLPSVSLPRLDQLIAHATTRMCLQLLEAMSLPSSAKVLIATLDMPNDSSFFTLASHIGGHASRENAPPIRSIAIDLFEGMGPLMGPVNVRQPARLGIAGRTSRSRHIHGTTERGSYISIEALTPMASEGQYLKYVMQSWPLSSATHLDIRAPHITVNHLDTLFAEVPAAMTTVIVHPGSKTAQSLLRKLRTMLREHGRRVFTSMIFDAAGVNTNEQAMRFGQRQWGGAPLPFTALFARSNMIQMMLYCAEAARAGVPLDTVEIFNESRELWKDRLISHVEGVNWSELYGNLQDGFVYEGILHSGKPDCDGREWESLAVVES